ncbi:MAG: Xaa-Pro peptidase family protein [Desulfomonilaceae bacterium]
MPSTPLGEIQRRITSLQSAMAENGFDAALIVQRVDLFYFSGTGQDAHLFVPVDGSPLLMVRKDFERAVQESPLESVSPVKSLSDLKKAVDSACPRGMTTLGMELDVLPVNNYRLYSELFPQAVIADISPLIKETRMVKSEYELQIIKQAARMNDAIYSQVGEILEEGMSEVEFAGLLEARYRKRGHQGFVRIRSFNNEVFYGHIMSGHNLAVPSCSIGPTGGPGVNATMPQGAGSKIIRTHEPVQIDYVGIVGGYLVDQSRTFFIGEPPEKFRKIHSTALAIQDALVGQGRPATRAEDLYNTAMHMAEEAGLKKGFMGYPQSVPFVGHGIGLELDELPVIGRKAPYVLKQGMVIALEPKFILPGEGLAGIENSFVVTEKGLDKLTNFADAIQIIQ